MAWVQLSVVTDGSIAISVSELMSSLGAVSTTFSDNADQPVYEPDPKAQPAWQQTKVTGLFESEKDTILVQSIIAHELKAYTLMDWNLETLEDKDWTRTWTDYFKPMQFGKRLWVYPSEYPLPKDDSICILLDPGLAFGTGTHPTTALCLEWLDTTKLDNQLVIDFGCGSGILAIAAALLGAKQVFAVDTDPQALTATKNNAVKNNVEAKVICCNPLELPPLQADIILANILANPLIDLVDQLVSLTRKGGHLVLSGILLQQIPSVLDAYSPLCQFSTPTSQEEWARLNATKR